MSFYTDVICKDPRFNSTDAISDVALLEPGTRTAVATFIQAAKTQGHDLRVAETYRSQARQHYLWTKGLTQLSRVGCHGYGVAVDLQLFVKGGEGKSIYDPVGEHYAFFQVLAVQVGLVSGIGWGTPRAAHTFTDWDHVQRVPVFRQAAMFAGTWYPEPGYHPYDDMRAASIAGMAPALPPLAPPPPEQPAHGAAYYQSLLNALDDKARLFVDGIWGPASRLALARWLQTRGLPPENGDLTPAAIRAMQTAAHP